MLKLFPTLAFALAAVSALAATRPAPVKHPVSDIAGALQAAFDLGEAAGAGPGMANAGAQSMPGAGSAFHIRILPVQQGSDQPYPASATWTYADGLLTLQVVVNSPTDHGLVVRVHQGGKDLLMVDQLVPLVQPGGGVYVFSARMDEASARALANAAAIDIDGTMNPRPEPAKVCHAETFRGDKQPRAPVSLCRVLVDISAIDMRDDRDGRLLAQWGRAALP